MRQNKLFVLVLIHIYKTCKHDTFIFCRVTFRKDCQKINVLYKYFGFFPFNTPKSRSHSIVLLEPYFPTYSYSLRRNWGIHVFNIQWNFYSTFSLWCYDLHNISNKEEGRNTEKENFITRNFCPLLFVKFYQKWLEGRGIKNIQQRWQLQKIQLREQSFWINT
jgi:hypothetical protein